MLTAYFSIFFSDNLQTFFKQDPIGRVVRRMGYVKLILLDLEDFRLDKNKV